MTDSNCELIESVQTPRPIGQDGAVLEIDVRRRFLLFPAAAAVPDSRQHDSIRGCRRRSSTVSGLQLGAGVSLLPVVVPVPVLGRHRRRQLGQPSPRLPVAAEHRRARRVYTGSRTSAETDPQDPRRSADRGQQLDRCARAR